MFFPNLVSESKSVNPPLSYRKNFFINNIYVYDQKLHLVFLKFKNALRGVVEDSSGLRDRGPGFKTRSRPLTFSKAATNFRTLHAEGFSCTDEFC